MRCRFISHYIREDYFSITNSHRRRTRNAGIALPVAPSVRGFDGDLALAPGRKVYNFLLGRKISPGCAVERNTTKCLAARHAQTQFGGGPVTLRQVKNSGDPSMLNVGVQLVSHISEAGWCIPYRNGFPLLKPESWCCFRKPYDWLVGVFKYQHPLRKCWNA